MRYHSQTDDISVRGTHQDYPVPDYDQGVVDVDDNQVIVTSPGGMGERITE